MIIHCTQAFCLTYLLQDCCITLSIQLSILSTYYKIVRIFYASISITPCTIQITTILSRIKLLILIATRILNITTVCCKFLPLHVM